MLNLYTAGTGADVVSKAYYSNLVVLIPDFLRNFILTDTVLLALYTFISIRLTFAETF
jgi:hypothetical protein